MCGSHNVNSIYTLLPPEEVDLSQTNQANSDQESLCEEGHCGCFLDTASLGEKPLLRGGIEVRGRMEEDRYYSMSFSLASWMSLSVG